MFLSQSNKGRLRLINNEHLHGLLDNFLTLFHLTLHLLQKGGETLKSVMTTTGNSNMSFFGLWVVAWSLTWIAKDPKSLVLQQFLDFLFKTALVQGEKWEQTSCCKLFKAIPSHSEVERLYKEKEAPSNRPGSLKVGWPELIQELQRLLVIIFNGNIVKMLQGATLEEATRILVRNGSTISRTINTVKFSLDSSCFVEISKDTIVITRGILIYIVLANVASIYAPLTRSNESNLIDSILTKIKTSLSLLQLWSHEFKLGMISHLLSLHEHELKAIKLAPFISRNPSFLLFMLPGEPNGSSFPDSTDVRPKSWSVLLEVLSDISKTLAFVKRRSQPVTESQKTEHSFSVFDQFLQKKEMKQASCAGFVETRAGGNLDGFIRKAKINALQLIFEKIKKGIEAVFRSLLNSLSAQMPNEVIGRPGNSETQVFEILLEEFNSLWEVLNAHSDSFPFMESLDFFRVFSLIIRKFREEFSQMPISAFKDPFFESQDASQPILPELLERISSQFSVINRNFQEKLQQKLQDSIVRPSIESSKAILQSPFLLEERTRVFSQLLTLNEDLRPTGPKRNSVLSSLLFFPEVNFNSFLLEKSLLGDEGSKDKRACILKGVILVLKDTCHLQGSESLLVFLLLSQLWFIFEGSHVVTHLDLYSFYAEDCFLEHELVIKQCQSLLSESRGTRIEFTSQRKTQLLKGFVKTLINNIYSEFQISRKLKVQEKKIKGVLGRILYYASELFEQLDMDDFKSIFCLVCGLIKNTSFGFPIPLAGALNVLKGSHETLLELAESKDFFVVFRTIERLSDLTRLKSNQGLLLVSFFDFLNASHCVFLKRPFDFMDPLSLFSLFEQVSVVSVFVKSPSDQEAYWNQSSRCTKETTQLWVRILRDCGKFSEFLGLINEEFIKKALGRFEKRPESIVSKCLIVLFLLVSRKCRAIESLLCSMLWTFFEYLLVKNNEEDQVLYEGVLALFYGIKMKVVVPQNIEDDKPMLLYLNEVLQKETASIPFLSEIVK